MLRLPEGLTDEQARDAVRRGGMKRVGKKPRYDAAADFLRQCAGRGLPRPVTELKFALDAGRHWRFDAAWPEFNLAVEIEGLVVKRGKDGKLQVGGRHASIQGFTEDARKYANAAIRGWYVLRFNQAMVKNVEAVSFTHDMLVSRGWARHG